jgi:hypothetical protein
VVTGVLGTWLQVQGARYAQRAGPRERPLTATLAGPGLVLSQQIFISDRESVAAFGAMLGNAGAAVLFASLVAGLTINFPGIWPVGITVFVLVLILGAVRIIARGTMDLYATRIMQEDAFLRMPPDGLSQGRAVTSNHRAEVLRAKPDLKTSILETMVLVRPFRLWSFVWRALRREEAAHKSKYRSALDNLRGSRR